MDRARPGVLARGRPAPRRALLRAQRLHGFLVLGAVVLCVTGGEALYADMGHFGQRPIRIAWFAVVVARAARSTTSARARCCSRDPARRRENPFYALVAVVGALPARRASRRVATVVASQALISGAFSLTQQAVQLGYSRASRSSTPRATEGQIYVPEVNWR